MTTLGRIEASSPLLEALPLPAASPPDWDPALLPDPLAIIVKTAERASAAALPAGAPWDSFSAHCAIRRALIRMHCEADFRDTQHLLANLKCPGRSPLYGDLRDFLLYAGKD